MMMESKKESILNNNQIEQFNELVKFISSNEKLQQAMKNHDSKDNTITINMNSDNLDIDELINKIIKNSNKLVSDKYIREGMQ
jgi:hypothetical protein